MRYSDNHKAETRQRIVEEAARRFRRDGVNATSVQTLMKAVDLTHGGFYAHFKSKDELVEEALRHCATELDAITPTTLSGEEPLATFICRYLSVAHRDEPAKGCVFPTISAELGQRGQASAVTDQAIKTRLAQIGEHMNSKEGATLVLSAMVGALMLSRSVVDSDLSERILAEASASLLKFIRPDQ